MQDELGIDVCVRDFEGVLHVFDLQIEQARLLVQLFAALIQSQLLYPFINRRSSLQLGLPKLFLKLFALFKRKTLEL